MFGMPGAAYSYDEYGNIHFTEPYKASAYDETRRALSLKSAENLRSHKDTGASYLLSPITGDFSMEPQLSRNTSFFQPPPDNYSAWVMRRQPLDLWSRLPDSVRASIGPPSAMSSPSSMTFSSRASSLSVDYQQPMFQPMPFLRRRGSFTNSDTRSLSSASSHPNSPWLNSTFPLANGPESHVSSTQSPAFVPSRSTPYSNSTVDMHPPHSIQPQPDDFEQQFDMELTPSPPKVLRKFDVPKRGRPPKHSFATRTPPNRKKRVYGSIAAVGMPSVFGSAEASTSQVHDGPPDLQPVDDSQLQSSSSATGETFMEDVTFSTTGRPLRKPSNLKKVQHHSDTTEESEQSLLSGSVDEEIDEIEETPGSTKKKTKRKLIRRSVIINTDSDRRRPNYIRPIEQLRKDVRGRLDSLLHSAPGNGRHLNARFPYEARTRNEILQKLGLRLVFHPDCCFAESSLARSTRRFKKQECEDMLKSLDDNHIYFEALEDGESDNELPQVANVNSPLRSSPPPHPAQSSSPKDGNNDSEEEDALTPISVYTP